MVRYVVREVDGAERTTQGTACHIIHYIEGDGSNGTFSFFIENKKRDPSC